jgi:NodT family efflux transporter outer membrane factor (OMF) lipoprotein
MLLLAAASCTVHESGHKTPVEPPGEFTGGGEATVPDRWWQAFSDPTLNALQRKALAGNFDLEAARDRLREARAVVDRESAARYPALDLSVSAEHQRRGSGAVTGSGDAGSEQLSTSLVADYEVDLWNRIDSTIEQTEFQQAARRADLKAAAITLTANVASTWYELVQQRGQRRILRQQIETNERVLEIVRRRFARGNVRASDVLRQQRLLESTRQQRSVVLEQIELLKHQLLVLTGRSPTMALNASGDALPQVPPKPDPGLPAELVHRRPDVRSAFYEVRAADRGIAVAIADRYPSLTLTASLSTSDSDATDLFDDWMRSIAGDLLQPVFDAGQRKAEVRRTESVKGQRLATYGQTVLTAFREVTDALSSEYHQRQQIRSIRKQLELAQRTSERLRREYLNGDISYIDVLDALTREQQLQRDLLQARFFLIENRIGLYRALAGGWPGIVPPAGESPLAGPAASQPAATQPAATQPPATQPRDARPGYDETPATDPAKGPNAPNATTQPDA